MNEDKRRHGKEDELLVVGGCDSPYLISRTDLADYQQAFAYAVMFGLLMLVAQLLVGVMAGLQLE